MTIVPGSRLGPYEITGKLGEGGMGEVFRATDPKLKRQVAIKVLPTAFAADADRLARFEREAQVLAQLQHPNIASIYGLEESGGVRALVMELVEGEDLAERLERGPLPLDEALAVARQIAEALDAAHEKGIVHRDLKPANVKLTAEGNVKLLDFGLAKALAGDGVSQSGPSLVESPTLTARATQAGMILGTAAYMSPEQARGKPADRRADIWAFGVVLFEMLTGKRAFEGETVSDTLAAILLREPDWSALPEQTPPPLKRLLRRCLQREPRLRIRDIGDARLELEELLAGLASGLLPAGDPSAATGSRVAAGGSSFPVRWARATFVLPWALAAAFAIASAVLALLLLRADAPGDSAIVRSTVVLPPGVRFRSENSSVALSRDGKRLAFAAAVGGARPQLWVRSTDSLVAQAIGGTEGATEPFWSPDGQHLGFFADRKLKRVPLSGGTVQTLCDAPDPRGGTWSERDVVVFTPEPFGGLRRVPASGGAPVALTETADKVTSDRMPVFLPGGDRVLYFHGSELGAKGNGIYCVDLESKKTTLVSTENSRPLLAPGALLFVRGANLMAQRFDASRLSLSGEPVTLSERVWFNPFRWTANASVSATGLLVVEPMDAAAKGQLTWMDLDGKLLGTVGEPGLFSKVAISPDGRRALVVFPDDKGASALWMLDLERGVSSRFVADLAESPCWSRDGHLVAYADGNGNLYVKTADGLTAPRLIVPYVSTNQRPTSFSADGGTLVFDRQTPEGWQLLSVDVHGEAKAQAIVDTQANDSFGVVSPDGGWIAWLSDETGRSEVYVMPYPKGERRQASSAGADDLFWLGREGDLAWVRDGRLLASRIGPGGPAAPRTLLGGPALASAQAIAAAPDGRRILVALPADGGSSGSLSLIASWPKELGKP